AFLVVMGIYMLHSLWEYRNGRHEYRMGIPRLIGVDQAMGDPNTFGATVLYALPLVVPFWMSYKSPRVRLLLVLYVALSITCIALTGSRSAFVGLLLLACMVVATSIWRGTLVLAAVVSAALLWTALPLSLQNRFETIIDPTVGPANAQESAEARSEG